MSVDAGGARTTHMGVQLSLPRLHMCSMGSWRTEAHGALGRGVRAHMLAVLPRDVKRCVASASWAVRRTTDITRELFLSRVQTMQCG